MKKPVFLLRCCIWIFVMVAGAGCAVMKDAGMWQTPEASFTATRLTALSLSGAEMEVEMEVFNPNPYSIFVGALDYALDIQETRVMSGEQNQGIRLEAGQRQKLTLPLGLEFAELAELVGYLRQKNTLSYAIEAGMRFDVPVAGILRVPLKTKGELPIPQLPRIRVAGLDLQSMSLGGAEMSLHLVLENPNAFSLMLERFDYSLILNGHAVAEGQVARKGVWEAGSENEIVLPLRLSFAQTGLALYNALRRGGEMDYRLGFDSEVGSGLPVLKSFPFQSEQQGKVALSR